MIDKNTENNTENDNNLEENIEDKDNSLNAETQITEEVEVVAEEAESVAEEVEVAVEEVKFATPSNIVKIKSVFSKQFLYHFIN